MHLAAPKGLDCRVFPEVLGHTTAGITERIYTHAFNREEREKRIREAQARAISGR
jgi:integrase